ncbi:hypothetical protein [Streptomyces longwoodensis]|uniref:hypothetical protein n=1 Tax=Streptomyces longwoodensis TaxID=68231 RepID=UPI0036FFA793
MLTLLPVGCGRLHLLSWPTSIHADGEAEPPPAPVRWFSDDYIGYTPYSQPYSHPYSQPYATPYP